MAKADTVLAKMRERCLSLPETNETLIRGEPHYRVGEKIFASCVDQKRRPSASSSRWTMLTPHRETR